MHGSMGRQEAFIGREVFATERPYYRGSTVLSPRPHSMGMRLIWYGNEANMVWE